MGSVGDSYDNALAETVIGLYKTELIRKRGPWRTLEAVESVLEGVANQQQRSTTVGGMSLELRTPEELMLLRNQLRLEVAREGDEARLKRGEVSHRFVRVRR